jgi:hypothetical protein
VVDWTMLDWGLSMFDGVEVDRWICISSTTGRDGVGDDQASKNAPVAFTFILHHGQSRRNSKFQDCPVSHEAE